MLIAIISSATERLQLTLLFIIRHLYFFVSLQYFEMQSYVTFVYIYSNVEEIIDLMIVTVAI